MKQRSHSPVVWLFVVASIVVMCGTWIVVDRSVAHTWQVRTDEQIRSLNAGQ